MYCPAYGAKMDGKEGMKMTLLRLNEILGQGIEAIVDENATPKEHQKALENAEYIAKLAKQIINNADVILRTDKMCNRNERANKVVGE